MARTRSATLWEAARLGDASTVLRLLSIGVDCDSSDSGGHVPLYLACKAGHEAVAALLLAASCRVSPATSRGHTPLYAASYFGHAKIVVSLLAAGASVDRRTQSGATALYAACANRHVDVAVALLAGGAQPDCAVQHGVTPLWIAAKHCHLELVALLIAAGARVYTPNEAGVYPLSIACHEGHVAVVRMLLGAGTAVSCPAAAAVPAASAATDPASAASASLHEPLYIACARGHPATARALLEAGADVDATARDGWPPIFVAARNGRLDCVQLCAAWGASRRCFSLPRAVELLSEMDDGVTAWLQRTHEWCTPLHHLHCLSAGRARRLLLDGADVHACTRPGGPTPVSLARGLEGGSDSASKGGGGSSSADSPAGLVLLAAAPWSPSNHRLFPAPARLAAATLMRLGHELANTPRFRGVAQAIVDVWCGGVMPHAVTRQMAWPPAPTAPHTRRLRAGALTTKPRRKAPAPASAPVPKQRRTRLVPAPSRALRCHEAGMP